MNVGYKRLQSELSYTEKGKTRKMPLLNLLNDSAAKVANDVKFERKNKIAALKEVCSTAMDLSNPQKNSDAYTKYPPNSRDQAQQICDLMKAKKPVTISDFIDLQPVKPAEVKDQKPANDKEIETAPVKAPHGLNMKKLNKSLDQFFDNRLAQRKAEINSRVQALFKQSA